jgi:predicted ferric reductase
MSPTALYPRLLGIVTGLAGAAVLLGWLGWVPETRAFWWLSRSGGVVAYSLLWLNILSGLLTSGRWLRESLAPALVVQLHQTLSGLALGFAAFHSLILLGDRYLSFGLVDLLLPFHASFHPVWLVAGQLATALLAAVIATSHWRKQLGNAAWRAIHLTAYAAYWLALAHALAIGTDQGGLDMFYALTGSSVLFLTTARILSRAKGGGDHGR